MLKVILPNSSFFSEYLDKGEVVRRDRNIDLGRRRSLRMTRNRGPGKKVSYIRTRKKKNLVKTLAVRGAQGSSRGQAEGVGRPEVFNQGCQKGRDRTCFRRAGALPGKKVRQVIPPTSSGKNRKTQRETSPAKGMTD